MTTAAFSGHDLACRRGERVVFAGLELALDGGDALVLRGPNGSGKTTLLRLLAGLLRPLAGRLCRAGDDIGDDPAGHRARLLWVGHRPAVKPALTVAENIRFHARLAGAGDDRAAAALATFGLDRLADLPAGILSAGQRRRLALARLLAVPQGPARPDLWLLDEPVTGLDARSVEALQSVIAGHRQAGGMVVLSSHGGIDIPAPAGLDLRDFAAGPETLPEDLA